MLLYCYASSSIAQASGLGATTAGAGSAEAWDRCRTTMASLTLARRASGDSSRCRISNLSISSSIPCHLAGLFRIELLHQRVQLVAQHLHKKKVNLGSQIAAHGRQFDMPTMEGNHMVTCCWSAGLAEARAPVRLLPSCCCSEGIALGKP